MKNFLKILLFPLILSFYVPNIFALNYDFGVIEGKWLEWTNMERSKYNLPNYKISKMLDNTALSWSEYSKQRGYIDHKRPGQKVYYDYTKIGKWFSSKGVGFKKIGTTTFSESIGWNTYSCGKSDCNENLIAAVRKTFDLYMKEKGKKYSPHYGAIINKDFSLVGIGLSLDETKHKYYLTVHYATEVIVKR